MAQIGFYYNQKMCAGCKTCQVACKDKNRLEVGPILREVHTYQIGSFPSVKMYHYSATCNHCDVPACKDVCPVGAIEKMDDGTVKIDMDKCIGCGSCVNACPYGVPRMDEGKGHACKCDACYDLRQAGHMPSCVESCPYRALDFGDIEELEKKYGSDLVRAIPAMGEDKTGSNTLFDARDIALEQKGDEMLL